MFSNTFMQAAINLALSASLTLCTDPSTEVSSLCRQLKTDFPEGIVLPDEAQYTNLSDKNWSVVDTLQLTL
jgi:hypothetical protein